MGIDVFRYTMTLLEEKQRINNNNNNNNIYSFPSRHNIGENGATVVSVLLRDITLEDPILLNLEGPTRKRF